MRAQIRSLNRSANNAREGLSLIQTADGAMNEVHDILHRMRELTVQSLNDTNVESDRAALADEFDKLQSEIDRISKNTHFNTQPVFQEHAPSYYQITGSRKWESDQLHSVLSPDNELSIHFPAGYQPSDYTISVAEGIYTTQELVDELEDALYQMTPSNPGFVFEFTDEGFCNLNLEGEDGTPVKIDSVDGGLAYLIYDCLNGRAATSLLGTTAFQGDWPQNRLEHSVANNENTRENLQESESVLRDADMGFELVAYHKNNILVQSAQAVLAQANQKPNGVFSLLQ